LEIRNLGFRIYLCRQWQRRRRHRTLHRRRCLGASGCWQGGRRSGAGAQGRTRQHLIRAVAARTRPGGAWSC